MTIQSGYTKAAAENWDRIFRRCPPSCGDCPKDIAKNPRPTCYGDPCTGDCGSVWEDPSIGIPDPMGLNWGLD